MSTVLYESATDQIQYLDQENAKPSQHIEHLWIIGYIQPAECEIRNPILESLKSTQSKAPKPSH